jgi:PhnB protein
MVVRYRACYLAESCYKNRRNYMDVVTTLNFNGQTEAALRHYTESLGAETLFLMRFRDSPVQSENRPGMEDKIFHATFRIQDTVIMASDVGCESPNSMPQFLGFSLALQMQSLAKAQQAFAALAVQGQVIIPLAPSRFTSWYGIVVDRFGLSWKFNVNTEDS